MNQEVSSLLSTEELAAIKRWLASADDSRRNPLSAGYQGAVYLFEGPNGRRIIKEAADSGLVSLFSRGMLRREARAYRVLEGIAGIPRCFGFIEGRYLVLEFIDGKNLRDSRRDIADRDAFFGELLDTVKAIHGRFVSHNDLKRKDNVIVTEGLEPVLIDFGLARVHDGNTLLFRLLRQHDYNSWIKIKYHYATDQISDKDLPYYRPTLLERAFRSLRKLWRTITFRQWRKARQKR